MLYIVHLAFCKAEASIEAHRRLLPELSSPYEFHCVELDYPNPSEQLNQQIRQAYFTSQPHCHWRKVKNLGHMDNIAAQTEFIGAGSDDAILFWDADHAPSPSGWLDRMLGVLKEDANCFYVTCSLEGYTQYYDNQGGSDYVIAKERCKKLAWPGGWPMGLHRGNFTGIKALRDFYGAGELSIKQALDRLGKYGYMLRDVMDTRAVKQVDKKYSEWKSHVTSKETQITFAEYLEGKRCT